MRVLLYVGLASARLEPAIVAGVLPAMAPPIATPGTDPAEAAAARAPCASAISLNSVMLPLMTSGPTSPLPRLTSAPGLARFAR